MKETFLKIIKGIYSTEETTKKEKTFIELFREFNEREALQNNLKEKTQFKYGNFCDNLETFLKSIHLQDARPMEINSSIIEDFRHWLHKNLSSCGNTHSSKHINRCKKVMDYALTKGMVKYNSIQSLRTKRDPLKEVVNLESDEFLKWTAAKWETLPYQKAQDLYTFQMSAGLSYIDLFDYKTVEDEETGLWIESKRGKRGKPYYVPLWHKDFLQALEIHNKYRGKLPFLNNGAYNRYLKEMACILKIEKYLTTHTGRKTFATLKDQSGWDIGAICSVMGNTENICRDHYIKTSRKKIEFQLRKLA